jgi:hypothetical protein
MKNEFIPYEQALELKELGFDEPCLAAYLKAGKLLDIGEYVNQGYYRTLAPLYEQAFRWFRERHGLSSWVYHTHMDRYFYTILQYGRTVKDNESVTTYEEAELACLKKLIELSTKTA